MLDAYDKARLDGFTGSRQEFEKHEYLLRGVDVTKSYASTDTEQKMTTNQPSTTAAKALIDMIRGEQGPQGPQGDRGEPGLDLYQLAVLSGFKGSFYQFMSSLKGENGDSIVGPMGPKGEQGPKGDKGERGADGKDGDIPNHQIEGGKVRFELPSGAWGEWVSIAAPAQTSQMGAGPLAIQKFYSGIANFPTAGKTQILYFDTSVDPHTLYIWDGSQYQAVGGSGSSTTGVDSWIYYAAHWSTYPTSQGTIAAGEVFAYELNGTTRYRLVPSPYVPDNDAFYGTFTAGVLGTLLVARTWADSVGGVSDHGLLTGLADDDHTQYHTDARGDARYSALAHTHTGTYQPLATVLTNTTASFTLADESAIDSLAATYQPLSAVLTATTASFTTADETKLDALAVMVGATSGANGVTGTVTAPIAGDQDKYLKGDGTWGAISSVDTVQTAAATGATTITAWGSVVLLPTLTGNITLTYPTPVGNIGKTIKVVQAGTPNAFTVTHTPAAGTITFTNAAGEISSTGGAFSLEAIDASNIRQVSNSVAATTVTALTYGRVKATAALPSISFAITSPGTKVPFDSTLYSSGMTFTGTDSIRPSQTGRYRVSWFMLSGSGDMNGDGTFHVVQGGVSIGSVFVDMMQAAGVNQVSNFIDVNLSSGVDVELRYQPVVADAVPFGAGSYFDITQLPTAVAPVVSTVAEYGEHNGITDGANFASALVDVTGSTFTLPSAGIWEVEFLVLGGNGTAGAKNSVGVYTTADVIVPNSMAAQTSVSGDSLATITLTNKIFITTTGVTQYKLKGVTGSGTFTVRNNVGAIASGNGSSKVTWTKISGQLSQTGSTVDYINITATANQTTGLTVGSPILFNTPAIQGNIAYSAGVFTLSAGKTYSLQGAVPILATGTELIYQWRDITNNVLIGASADNHITAAGRNTVATANLTPTTAVTVRLEILVNTLVTDIGGSNGRQAWANIIQLGSTSNTVGTLAAVDQSAAGYFDIGNMRQQWGTFTQGSSAMSITLPAAFANSSYVVTGNVQDVSATTIVVGTTFSTKTTTSFTSLTNSWNGTAVNASASRLIGWTAIGQKP